MKIVGLGLTLKQRCRLCIVVEVRPRSYNGWTEHAITCTQAEREVVELMGIECVSRRSRCLMSEAKFR